MEFLDFAPGCVVTQTWLQHKQRAIENGWCWKPQKKCSKYYYPGIDKAPAYGISSSAPIVLNAYDGDVFRTGTDDTGYGIHVRTRLSDGSTLIYAHLDKILCNEKDHLKPGAPIGVMGNTGNSTGLHCHFEWRDKNGIPIDPTPFFVVTNTTPAPIFDRPAPPPPPSHDYPLVTTKWRALRDVNIRLEPDTSSAVLGLLHKGDVITVSEGVELTLFRVFLKHDLGWSAFYYDDIIYIRPEKA